MSNGMRLSYSAEIPGEFQCYLPILDPNPVGAYLCGVYITPSHRGAAATILTHGESVVSERFLASARILKTLTIASIMGVPNVVG